jgi:flagellar FliL protein
MDEEPALLTGPPPPMRESALVWLVTTGLLTPLAALTGALGGWYLVDTVRGSVRTVLPAPLAQAPTYPPTTTLHELAPIITNLAEPPETWVRLQAAIILDSTVGRKPELVAAQIGDDILGYLRTISLSSIGGASGLRHLREDLNERARIRSDGQVRELVIRTLVVQ